MKFKIIKLLCLSLIALLLFTGNLISAKELPTVSIFDVKQEKVVKVMPLTLEFKNSVFQVLKSSPAVYGGFSMNPKNGLILHIPFHSPVEIPHRFYSDRIKEIYLFLEYGSKPKALLFLESKQRQIIVELDYDPDKFIKMNNL